MINCSFRNREKNYFEKVLPHLLKKKIQKLPLKILVISKNTWACLIALISDLVIGYHVSCHVAGSMH